VPTSKAMAAVKRVSLISPLGHLRTNRGFTINSSSRDFVREYVLDGRGRMLEITPYLNCNRPLFDGDK
jgi:hypothetical protein